MEYLLIVFNKILDQLLMLEYKMVKLNSRRRFLRTSLCLISTTYLSSFVSSCKKDDSNGEVMMRKQYGDIEMEKIVKEKRIVYVYNSNNHKISHTTGKRQIRRVNLSKSPYNLRRTRDSIVENKEILGFLVLSANLNDEKFPFLKKEKLNESLTLVYFMESKKLIYTQSKRDRMELVSTENLENITRWKQ